MFGAGIDPDEEMARKLQNEMNQTSESISPGPLCQLCLKSTKIDELYILDVSSNRNFIYTYRL
jgi:hypothetical protein